MNNPVDTARPQIVSLMVAGRRVRRRKGVAEVARTVTVGLIADPGLPERIARYLVEDLQADLAREIGGAHWRIEASRETLPLSDTGEIPLSASAPRVLEQHGWDAVVYLTDLPRRHEGEPILAELSSNDRIVLVCLPTLGAFRVTARTRAVLVPLLTSVAGGSDDAGAATRALAGTSSEPMSSGVRYLIRPGRLNRLRLLAGMVRNNRPGSLVPALSRTIAAGVGTGAFGVFYASIWTMADSLSPGRLALISVAVIVALSSWLIFYNGLWTTDHDFDGSGSRWLDNAATLLTVGITVASMYLMLYLLLLGGALLIITSDYLADQLQRPVTALDYLRLSWLAASLGTVGGAIGSNFDSDRAIAEATYSRREYERRRLAKGEDSA